MEPIIFSLLIFTQYYLTFRFLAKNDYNSFLVLYICSIFAYDLIFINASYYLPITAVTVFKPYTEYLLLYLSAHILWKAYNTGFRHLRPGKLDKLIIVTLILPTVAILLLDDLATGTGLGDTITGLRIYILPILFPYVLYKCGMLRNYNPSQIVNTIIILCVLTGIYGVFQKAMFNGDVGSLWFYRFFDSYPVNPVAEGPANYIRNNVLRTTGVFVSPIIYSIAFSTPVIFILSIFAYSFSGISRYSRLMLAAALAFFIYCQVASETRIGLFIDCIAIALIVLTKFRRISFAMFLLVPVGAVCFTFAALFLDLTKDLSALGRLVQYRSFFQYFKPAGLGFYNNYVQTYFDTFYMSAALLYGVLVVFPLFFFYKINGYAVAVLRQDRTNYFIIAVLVLSFTFIYSFMFQFTAGAYPYRMYFLLLFMIFTHARSHDTKPV